MPKNKKEKGRSFMQIYHEINAREEAAEAERQAEEAEKERKARDAYAEKLRQDKLELLKLKQGVITEDQLPHEEKEEKHYTVWEKIGNFFYHNKMYIIFGTLFAALVVFLAYDIFSTVHPDAAVMIIAENDDFAYITEDIESVLERYCPDYNGDGKIFIRVSYMPAESEEVSYYNQSQRTKLIAEFQAGDSIIVIGNKNACELTNITEGVLADMREIYPDDENAFEYGYMLDGTSFAEDIGYEQLPDDLFIAFRVPQDGFGVDEDEFTRNYENALEIWDNYINGNEINPKETISETTE